jgi:glycosyltransferase involved in cell wall biosynthesis
MRVSYWTGWLDPQMVAVSKEVHQLRRCFPGSCAFGISPHYRLHVSISNRSLGIHPCFYPLARPILRFLESRFDVTHIYTSLGDWHFLSALGSRPIVLTLTQHGEPGKAELLQKTARVIAETERLAESARRHGVPHEKVSVIHPGVDLDLFAASPPPARPWKCLFASSPENRSEIATKGVNLLLDVAALIPDVEFTILWRPFGPQADLALEDVKAQAPSNVKIIKQRVPNMHAYLQQFHFVVAPFRSVGKPCPNSILESLAVGRPVLISDFVDIGDLVEETGSGVSFACTPQSFADAVNRVCAHYDAYQHNARPCAERHFDFRHTLQQYSQVYESLAS